MEKHLSLLTKTLPFSGFTTEEVMGVIENLRLSPVIFQKGEVIFTQGERVSQSGIILKGSITAQSVSYSGEQRVISILSSGDVFGDVLMSGNAAAGNLEGFLYAAQNAFHQTTVNFVGQNVGARQYRRANKTVWLCQGCVIVVDLTIAILFNVFGEFLLGIYISDSPEAIACGMLRLVYMMQPYFLFGLLDVSTGALRGYGRSLGPMIVSVLGICGLRLVWISTVFQLPAFHNPMWLYMIYPISWIITLTVQSILFFRVRNQYLHKDITEI